MINIVLFGPPGAGKGTQAAKLLEKYQLIHLSTGDLLRSEITRGTELGLSAKSLMDKGILVPDETVIAMIKNKILENKNTNGFIFDGFPRTEKQAQALDKMLTENGTQITLMLALEVEETELINRLLNRGKTSGRADDQDPAIIQQRIQEYNNKTAPVKAYYTQQNKFYAIDGIGPIDDIFDRLCKKIDAYA